MRDHPTWRLVPATPANSWRPYDPWRRPPPVEGESVLFLRLLEELRERQGVG